MGILLAPELWYKICSFNLLLKGTCQWGGFSGVFAEIGSSGSRWLSDSPSRGVAFWMFKRKSGESESLPDSANRGVASSPTQRVGELSTPRLGESGSRHGESGSRYSNFLKFSIDFPDFKRLNQPILVNSPTWRVGESFFDYEYLREYEAQIGTAQNVV